MVYRSPDQDRRIPATEETSPIRLSPLIAGVLLSIMSLGGTSSAQENAALQRLTVPPELLPDGCRLAPRGGLPFSPRDSNPVFTTDSDDLGVLSGFVLGAAGVGPDLRDADDSERQQLFQAWAAEQAAKIAEAYTATYLNADRKGRGVLALLFQEPIDGTEIRIRRTARDSVILKDALIIFAFANRQGDL